MLVSNSAPVVESKDLGSKPICTPSHADFLFLVLFCTGSLQLIRLWHDWVTSHCCVTISGRRRKALSKGSNGDNSERKGSTRQKRLRKAQWVVPVVTQSDKNNNTAPQMHLHVEKTEKMGQQPPSLSCISTGSICSSAGYPAIIYPAFSR